MLRSAASAAVTAAFWGGGGGQCSHAAAGAVHIGLLRQWAARQPGASPQPPTPEAAAAAAAAGLSTSAAAAAEAAAAAAAGASPANAMALIKQLRAESGAPIADVKSCLEAANWQMEGAMEALRLKGLAAAVKKASRHASEGLVAVGQESPHCVAVVEVNSETDFVGRSEPFQQLIKAAAGAALCLAPSSAPGGVHALNLQQLSDAPLPGSSSGSSVAEACASLAGKVRENIALRRGWLVSSGPHGVVSSYVHMPVTPGAGRIAAVVALEASGSQALPQDTLQQLSELAAQLAMHSAGMNTQHVSAASMPADVLAAVRADVASQTEALMQGKPPAVLAKAVEGKVAKWLKESCLLDQRFVLDDSLTVAQLLKAKAQQLGLPGALEVTGLLRAQVGEGLERADGDRPAFADEVAAMAGTAK